MGKTPDELAAEGIGQLIKELEAELRHAQNRLSECHNQLIVQATELQTAVDRSASLSATVRQRDAEIDRLTKQSQEWARIARNAAGESADARQELRRAKRRQKPVGRPRKESPVHLRASNATDVPVYLL